jgi:mannitol-specific phosphotransferase system IIBC component
LEGILTPQEINENGILTIIASVVITLLVSYFKNKIKNDNTHEENYNNQFNEFLKVAKTQLEQSVKLNESYRHEITEIKKLILNQSNMNVSDFSTFMKTTYSNITMQLEKEMTKIIEINHITVDTLDITNSKVDNTVNNIINTSAYSLQFLNYDSETLNTLITFYSKEKPTIQQLFKDIVSDYANSSSDYRKADAIRRVEESVKYIYNSFISNLYDVMNH